MHLFWFPEETLAPITLLECGIFGFGLSKPGVPTFIGIEPGYKRAKNMIITAKELRPDIVIVHTLDDLAKQITDYVNGKKTRK